MEQNVKPWYLSKTILLNMIGLVALIIAPKFPAAKQFLDNYFAEAGSGWMLVNMVLRLVSKDKVSIT